MAKRKKYLKPMPKITKIEEDDYWKLRCLGEEVAHQESKVKLAESSKRICELQNEINALKSIIFNFQIKDHEKEIEQTKTDYVKIKTEIEGKIGQSLNDCTIDPINFTVHKGV